MPKLLTITGMAVSLVILLIFLLDLIGLFVPAIAPFQGASPLMDTAFVVCAVVLAYLSWSTYQEVK